MPLKKVSTHSSKELATWSQTTITSCNQYTTTTAVNDNVPSSIITYRRSSSFPQLKLSRAKTLATRYYLQLHMYKVILKRLACILWLISSAYLALKVMQVRNKVSAEEEDVEDDIVATASKRSQMNHKTYLPRCWITEILFGLRADTHRSTAQLLIGDA